MSSAAFAHPEYPNLPGIVGGLGPWAHVAFERRLLQACDGTVGDAGYPPWVLVSAPHTPDRTEALTCDERDPLPFLVTALHRLCAAGATFAVIPCNTAHAYLGRLAPLAPLPVLDVRREVAATLAARGEEDPVGLLATDGTVASGVFAATSGAPLLVPDAEDQRRVMEVIRAIKGGGEAALGEAGAKLARVSTRLAERGARVQLIACSELSLLGPPTGGDFEWLDTMSLLARATLREARGPR